MITRAIIDGLSSDEISISESDGSISVFTCVIKGRIYRIIQTPFHNCQTFGIAKAESLISLGKDTTIKHLQAWANYFKRRQVVMDVHLIHEKNLVDWFGEEKFKVRQKYTNSNGSLMVMCLIEVI